MSQRLDHWKLGFSQCRFHLAYRTCNTSRYIPSRLTAFPTCCFSLCVSTPGKSGVLEGITLNLISLQEKFAMHRNGAPERHSRHDPRYSRTKDRYGYEPTRISGPSHRTGNISET